MNAIIRVFTDLKTIVNLQHENKTQDCVCHTIVAMRQSDGKNNKKYGYE